MEKIRIADNGCWLWTSGIDAQGRGRLAIGSRTDGTARTALAHRVAYELLVGPIPDGLTLDHICHNRDPDCGGGNSCLHRRCVNPDHLEPAPIRKNILRGKGRAARNAVRTHCRRGHPLKGENLIVLADGRRQCRACRRARMRRYNQTPERKDYNRQNAQGEKRKASMRAYRKAAREKIRIYQRERRRALGVIPREPVSVEEKAERKRRRGREHYRENRERIMRERAIRRSQGDPEDRRARQREYARAYYERNRDAINARKRARRAQDSEKG